jgi:hypothetical protein
VSGWDKDRSPDDGPLAPTQPRPLDESETPIVGKASASDVMWLNVGLAVFRGHRGVRQGHRHDRPLPEFEPYG